MKWIRLAFRPFFFCYTNKLIYTKNRIHALALQERSCLFATLPANIVHWSSMCFEKPISGICRNITLVDHLSQVPVAIYVAVFGTQVQCKYMNTEQAQCPICSLAFQCMSVKQLIQLYLQNWENNTHNSGSVYLYHPLFILSRSFFWQVLRSGKLLLNFFKISFLQKSENSS